MGIARRERGFSPGQTATRGGRRRCCPAPGDPDEEARAPESPITIPAFQQIDAARVDAMRQEIEAAIREACAPRHDLCVTTVVVARNGADAHACFGGTDPASSPAGATLPRGTVLTIFSQLRESEPVDCRPEPTGEPPPSGS